MSVILKEVAEPSISVIAVDPDHGLKEALENTGTLHLAMGNTEARQLLDHLLKINLKGPGVVHLYLKLGFTNSIIIHPDILQ
ncbi:MAG: hypothetical protein K9N22_03210 [Candidatus Marinimicrobia bacterium]|nr:hypothetical protein [Candidatus Neomarinimicrobiota bacterium]